MTNYDFDFICIGAGSAGARAARVAASLGAKTLIIEKDRLGGTCVNLGCVPKKLWVYASHFRDDFAVCKSFGWDIAAPPTMHFQKLMENKDREIARLNDAYARGLQNAGVTLWHGTAEFVDEHTVAVESDTGNRTASGRNILISTGGKPSLPAGIDRKALITSDDAFVLDTLPKKVAVVGGGYIGVEFSGIFAGLGSQTTLIYRGPQLLRHFDHELGQRLAQSLPHRDIEVRLNTDIKAIEKVGAHSVITLSDGEKLEFDKVLYATGRVPNTAALKLDRAGVKTDKRGAIMVGAHEGHHEDIGAFRTAVPHILAAGDVIDRVQLTPVALAEGMAIAHGLFGKGHDLPNYNLIPTAIFSIPEIGTVGLSEQEAKTRHGDDGIVVFAADFRPMKYSLSDEAGRIFMKLVVHAKSDKVLGVHMMGEGAGEIIQSLAVALTAGATKGDFDRTMSIHPSAAEEFVTMREPR